MRTTKLHSVEIKRLSDMPQTQQNPARAYVFFNRSIGHVWTKIAFSPARICAGLRRLRQLPIWEPGYPHMILAVASLLAVVLAGKLSADTPSEAIRKFDDDQMRRLVDDRLRVLKTSYDESVKKIQIPLEELGQKYLTALDRMRDNARSVGDLATVTTADEAITSFRQANAADTNSTNPKVVEMAKIYTTEASKLGIATRPLLIQACREYLDGLQKIVRELTQANLIAEAKKVSFMVEQVEGTIKELLEGKAVSVGRDPSPGGENINELIDSVMAYADRSRDISDAKVINRLISGRVVLSGKCHAPNGLLVSQKATLVMEAGAVLIMAENSEFIVEGRIIVKGTPGRYVLLCGAKKMPGSWNGLSIRRMPEVKNNPIAIEGLIVTDAKRGIDYELKIVSNEIFDVKNSIFVGNIIGLYLDRFGSGVAPIGSIVNCLFANNEDTGVWLTKILDDKTRLINCTFLGNKTGMTTTESAFDLPKARIAERCLFIGNNTAVLAEGRCGAIRESEFEDNDVDLATTTGQMDLGNNFWGAETTRLLSESEGVDSGNKISPKVPVKDWLSKPPTKKVGSDLPGM